MSLPFRRQVLYIPGYDPFPPRRYRELYRREGVAQAAISAYRIAMAKREQAGPGFGWAAETVINGQAARGEVEVLVWDDIVQRSMGRGIIATYGQLVQTAWAYIGSGALFRLMRLRRGPVLAALYPIIVLTLQLLAAIAAGLLCGWLVSRVAGWWAGLPAGAGVVWAVLVLWQRHDNRFFAHYLMHDYAFTAAENGAYPRALAQRVERFRDRIADALQGDWDEVLVIGHSSGAYLAVSALSALPADHDTDAPALSLMTLGHVVPMASFLPRADRLRADLAALSRREDLFWLDVTAPGDACCFALCDPVAVSGVAPVDQRWPLVISAAFTQTLSSERQAALRNRWFKLHFQYLCAFDRPGDYDYFAITAGPQTLAQRFAGRAHSPGRITLPAGRAA
ncbi:hypothetical protein MLD63_06210 [Paracoccus sp. TK19116]|uniref:Alpha/beta hydrolase n=1 Tax=Paracoccus albicereus TaxID=2922394 RepID=A0ABT1MNZ8_9RHOB|nr:hypothetical protein [Paracoccus albicereus]MCQ0970018.1 hypothetical protein [Paracoccus albicereus]